MYVISPSTPRENRPYGSPRRVKRVETSKEGKIRLKKIVNTELFGVGLTSGNTGRQNEKGMKYWS